MLNKKKRIEKKNKFNNYYLNKQKNNWLSVYI